MSKQSGGEWKNEIGAKVMIGGLSATVTAHGRAHDNSAKDDKAPLLNMCLLEIDVPSGTGAGTGAGCPWVLRGTWVQDSQVQPAPAPKTEA